MAREIEVERGTVTVTVTRSAGVDGTVVVFIDTDFEPNRSDGGPGLRVLINDDKVYGPTHMPTLDGEPRQAGAKELIASFDEIAYSNDNDSNDTEEN